MSRYRVLFSLTGSIACYKSCYIISKLVQSNMDVQVACTQSSLEFIGKATLEGLTRRDVYSSMFNSSKKIEHVDLSEWYDLAIICPATGNIINKIAAGIADDPVSCLFLAHDFKRPYIIAPAMNARMYEHPRTQESIQTLKNWGIHVLETETGYQACGTIGVGRLLSPEAIVEIIMNELNNSR